MQRAKKKSRPPGPGLQPEWARFRSQRAGERCDAGVETPLLRVARAARRPAVRGAEAGIGALGRDR